MKAVSEYKGYDPLSMTQILNTIMINKKDMFYIEKMTFQMI